MKTNRLILQELRKTIEDELNKGESTLWVGMPRPTYFSPESTGGFLFAIPWTAFSIFWICGAAGFKIPDFKEGFDFFPLFGLPFFLIGIGMLSMPLRTYKKSLKTAYVITNKRAIILTGGRNTIIRSYYPKDLGNIYRKEKRNGTGDVIFDQDYGDQNRVLNLGFLRIQDAKKVEQMLNDLALQVES